MADADPARGREHDAGYGRRARRATPAPTIVSRVGPAAGDTGRVIARLQRARVARMTVEWHAAQPQPQRMPVDEGDRLVAHRRVADEDPQQVAIGQRSAPQHEARAQQRPAVRSFVDADAQAAGIVADRDDVPADHADERRHVERLVHRTAESNAARPLRLAKRVEVALSVGVVDLDDDDAERAVGVSTEVEAGRVEDIAKDSQVRHQGHLPAGRIDALGAKVTAEVGVEVCRRGRKVVGIDERRDRTPMASEEAETSIELADLGQVEADVPDVVLEAVVGRRAAAMPDLADQQVRPHAATPASTAATSPPTRRSAARSTARRPHSQTGSHPRGSHSRGERRRTTCAGGPAARQARPGRRASGRCTADG